MKADQISSATFRELAHRKDGAVDVTLLWSARENRLAVTVFDERADELLVLNAESERALDVFYHPFAHAHRRRPYEGSAFGVVRASCREPRGS
jgi:hypothetical protein